MLLKAVEVLGPYGVVVAWDAGRPAFIVSAASNGVVEVLARVLDMEGGIGTRYEVDADGRYTGTAGDVVGTAQGKARGNAFYWTYTLSLPVNGSVYEVQFDDWMYLMTDKVMLNKATMRKLGVRLGEVTLSFTKR